MPGNTELLTQSLLSLLLVLAIIVGLLYASKWFMQRRPRGGRRLRFIEAMAVGNKEKLILVEVDDRQLLLGVSANQVNLIKELDSVSDNKFAQQLADQVAQDQLKQDEANS